MQMLRAGCDVMILGVDFQVPSLHLRLLGVPTFTSILGYLNAYRMSSAENDMGFSIAMRAKTCIRWF